ncbi:ribonuclease H-like domain-containing protein [Tanacetum coccineum]
MDQDFAHMVAASKVPMLKPGEFEIWRMGIKQYIQMIDYALWEVIENGNTTPKTTVVEGVEKLKFNSIKDAKLLMEAVEKRFEHGFCILFINNNSSTNGVVSTAQAVNFANGVSAANTQVNAANIDNLSDAIICAFLASQPNSPQLAHEDLKLTINGNEFVRFDKSKVECYNCHKKGHFAKDCRAPRNQDYKNKESKRRTVPMETSISIDLVSCDGLGGSNSKVSNNSNYSKSCLKTVKTLKSQYDQLHKDFKKLELMVLAYKSGLESVEEKLEVYKANESIYSEDIKSVDNCKKGLGYNAVPLPYTGNFMLLTPDLSFTGLDEFVNKPVVKNKKSDEEVSKVVRKSDDSLIIKDWVSDSEEENVSHTKTKKKTVKPSIAKIEFVKPKQQEKTARKTVKQVKKNRQNTHSLRGNQ